MELTYDEEGDILYLYFYRSPVEYSERINPSVIIDYDKEGRIRGIEVLQFSKSNLDLNQLIQLSKDELVAQVKSQ